MKLSMVMFKNDTTENPKRPVFTVLFKDEAGNEYEGGLWYATDDAGSKKKSAKGDFYWTGKAEPKKEFASRGAAKGAAPKRKPQDDEPF
jgi:hypothetical protein